MHYFDNKQYGQRIKKIRELRKIEPEDLAEAVGYTDERSIRRLESGSSSGGIDKLMELSQTLEVSTDYLLFGEEKNNVNCKITEFLADKSIAEQEFALKMLESLFENKKMLTE
ncbi:helix-turn-helix domain-containing protein [Lachnotalea glycerini]|uniref:XRE family transcriptional regulator n=1 Tax=Lachnotalea glycerini TaxID=1763509 RepID=A0A371JGZ5_9FIRM|nr:helix-turn-helix transcriptional regulator [Lachnotalea glycerini]RDY32003.1 XRE family transcriptional regulator [Lachnotalea glycerini]